MLKCLLAPNVGTITLIIFIFMESYSDWTDTIKSLYILECLKTRPYCNRILNTSVRKSSQAPNITNCLLLASTWQSAPSLAHTSIVQLVASSFVCKGMASISVLLASSTKHGTTSLTYDRSISMTHSTNSLKARKVTLNLL
jgi:hypothetical protein